MSGETAPAEQIGKEIRLRNGARKIGIAEPSCHQWKITSSFWLPIAILVLSSIWVGGLPELAQADQPNIVLINLDDADRDMFRPDVLASRFPNMNSIANEGITFTNFHVTSPLCGPSRACLVRGQYAHALNHRINDGSDPSFTRGFTGDYISFREKGFADNDFGKWMQDAGYHTIFVGKYINAPATTPPRLHRGWNDFYLARHGVYFKTPRFTNRWNPNGSEETLPEGAYRTNVEGLDCARTIRQQANNNRPLFLYYAPYGPHFAAEKTGGMVDPDFEDLWPNLSVFKNESYDEVENDDKPEIYSQVTPMTPRQKESIEELNRDRMLSTKSIDIAVGRIIRALVDTGRFENTYFIVTSDNGYLMGHHRITAKSVSLTQATNVPTFVSGPGIPANSTANHLLAHIDIAPTLLDLAGARMKPFFDGKSFKPILHSTSTANPRSWRDSFLVENWQNKRQFGQKLRTTFVQLRMYDSAFTEFADGSREFYDLANDPMELDNQAGTLETDQKELFYRRIADHRHNMPEPITTVEDPVAEESMDEGVLPTVGPHFPLSGVAEDTNGVTQVRLVIVNQKTQRYWNGSNWQKNRATINADLKNPGGIVTEWDYLFDPGETVKLSDVLTMTARAYSESGCFSRSIPIRKFQYDSFPPVTKILESEITQGRIRLLGTIRDNHQIKQIGIELKDSQGNYFGRFGWQQDQTCICMPVDASGEWIWYSPVLAKGIYTVQATAHDRANNPDPTPSKRRFVLE